MFEEERKREIADYIQQKGRASVLELAQYFQVSESTVRRDLRDLEDTKLLRRTHGGAVSIGIQDNREPSFIEKEDRFSSQKEAVAEAALNFIEDGESIFLDSGTTTYKLAKRLHAFSRLTVVTNSVMVVQILHHQPNINLLLTGGSLRHETQAMVGPLADRSIGSVKFDKLFLAINGIEPGSGLTTPNLIEAETKRRMIESAKQVILLADHSKYGKVSFGKVADLTEIHHCIIDQGISADAVREMEAEGIQVTIAKDR
ncbi:DeoR faimly transcriptional regulator [Paenibacillus beijingensis]|uniref:DeoR faimly transcriptional regulator n=1 Tax=Paenibacillus beijingensis TaxID=1126833 RepID=A0A0D5NQC2_9BACL|nr:DeoR faimly transcriptional regulator [Paenibacillus beijingensis]